MDTCIFIHTNAKQRLGAVVARHALRRHSLHNEHFEIRLLQAEDHPFLTEHHGRSYLRGGEFRTWRADDLQSFTPLRFMPPELMRYCGRALVIDPDVFAVTDVWQLLSKPMDAAIAVRPHPKKVNAWASSVMLLDCARLTHWRCEDQFRDMFAGRRDYAEWIGLRLEDSATLEALEPSWNDFDHLDSNTRMLHTTRRRTQPWKTGLPIDWRPKAPEGAPWKRRWLALRRRLFGEYAFLGRYEPHPDPRQEQLFFGLLRECLAGGELTTAELKQTMDQKYVRPDAWEVLERTPALPAPDDMATWLAAERRAESG